LEGRWTAPLRRRKIAPYIAMIAGRKTPSFDSHTTRHAGYAMSQRKRKRVEEIFTPREADFDGVCR